MVRPTYKDADELPDVYNVVLTLICAWLPGVSGAVEIPTTKVPGTRVFGKRHIPPPFKAVDRAFQSCKVSARHHPPAVHLKCQAIVAIVDGNNCSSFVLIDSSGAQKSQEGARQDRRSSRARSE